MVATGKFAGECRERQRIKPIDNLSTWLGRSEIEMIQNTENRAIYRITIANDCDRHDTQKRNVLTKSHNNTFVTPPLRSAMDTRCVLWNVVAYLSAGWRHCCHQVPGLLRWSRCSCLSRSGHDTACLSVTHIATTRRSW